MCVWGGGGQGAVFEGMWAGMGVSVVPTALRGGWRLVGGRMAKGCVQRLGFKGGNRGDGCDTWAQQQGVADGSQATLGAL